MAVACAIVILAWLCAALQWPLHDKVVPWDSKNQFYAFFRFLADCLHNGYAPFWNPYHYGGHPSVADPQSLIFSPAFLLWALVDPHPSLFAFDAMVYLHLLIGGLALVFYGRRRGWASSACVLAALIFMFGGPAASRLNHVGIVIAYGVAPLALLWLDIALEDRSYKAAAAFGAAYALIILGRSHAPLLLACFLGAATISTLWRAGDRLGFFRSRLPILCVAGAVTLALIAVPLLLTLQFAAFSNRPEIDLELALRSSLYPLNLATFLAPDVFGSLRRLADGTWGPAYQTRPDLDSTDRAFNYLFMGSLPALLFLWHGVAGGRAAQRGLRFAAGVVTVALLYAVGRYSPIFPFLFEHVPGFDLFRRPVGATYLVGIGMALLCGELASAYIAKGTPALSRAPALAMVLAVAALLAWAIDFSTFSSHGWEAAVAVAGMLPAYVALTGLMLLPTTGRGRDIAMTAAVLFTAVQLVATNAAMPMNAEPRAVYAMLETPTPEVAAVIAAIRADMQARHDPSARPRVEIAGLGGPWQNAAMVFDLESTNGYNPLRIGPYDRLVSPGESPYPPLSRKFPGSFPGYDCLLGQLLGLEYVILDRPIEKLPNPSRRPVANTLVAGPNVWVYRLAHAAPRVTIDSRVEVADASEYVDDGTFPTSISPSEVLVDVDDPLSQKYPARTSARPASARITQWRPDRIEIAVQTDTPGILTLHDPWYPGWEVEVDGQPRPLLRTDILFRGVEAPPGAHTIVFSYRPFSLHNLIDAAETIIEPDE